MITNETTEMGMGNKFLKQAHRRGHPAVVEWHDEWIGRRWQDMPGPTEEFKKLNFALFRRGLLMEGKTL